MGGDEFAVLLPHAGTRRAQQVATRLGAALREDAATLEALRTWGCEYGQGYFIARPMADGEFSA
jgi:GGDEF domain-containing protein